MSLQPQIYTIGFESYNPILNLGGLYVIISFTMVQMFVIGLYYALRHFMKRPESVSEGGEVSKGEESSSSTEDEPKDEVKPKVTWKTKCMGMLRRHSQSLFFEQPIVIIKESFIQLFLSGLLFFTMPWDLKK